MRGIGRVLLLCPVILATGQLAQAQCSNSQASYFPSGTYAVYVSVGSGLSAADVDRGLDTWNLGCGNDGAQRYPDFTLSSTCTTSPCVDVELVSGHGPLLPGGIYPDAEWDPLTGTVKIYTVSGASPGSPTNLDSNHIAFYVAHELGHALGLAHDSCFDGIMNLGSGTDAYAVADECNSADIRNTTYYETYGHNPGGGGSGGGGNACESGICPCTCLWGQCDWTCQFSPILIDLDGEGYRLTGLNDPVSFDLDADGDRDTVGWTARNTRQGFLCLDRDRNGVIDSGRELFGNHTPLASGEIAVNGFNALADFDGHALGGNGDRAIDRRDAAFLRLRVWIDRNHNGFSEPEEILTLPEAGVAQIELRYEFSGRVDEFGNRFKFKGKAWLRQRQGGLHPVRIYDVFFVGRD